MEKALIWANQFSHFCFFNSNQISFPSDPFKDLLAVGSYQGLYFDGYNDFDRLKQSVNSIQDWLIGHFSYDLKNQVEDLASSCPDRMQFEDIAFFQPNHLIFFNGSSVTIQTPGDPHAIFNDILNCHYTQQSREEISLTCSLNRDEYLEHIRTIKEHILEGDIYELNYCIEFFSEDVSLDPINFFVDLKKWSPTPFSTCYKCDDRYALSASPERFIKKHQDSLISQPIKGTAGRGNSFDEDEFIKQQLRTDEKELAENMMIVDLVRNDLARSSEPGSVKVDEMFGIYTFNQVHQMISTVSSTLRENVHCIDAIKNAFPMGSMTGAPKIKVMQLIDSYEKSRRGLYSGSIGYITPNGDFDFNVVIRTLLYNSGLKRLSFHVGSAITYDSDPVKEYEECMLKATSISQLLTLNHS
ncbi:anthranilate synthase component I family protein [Fulvivirga sp. M361]|uniref:anthranilate synthase component I family protein n=1 Tax=Fulvivirga sp. M361 TaxID=2594266 RepID=UPI0021031202|nr:anthranilate synthase component I family protein [Fulvivirga sp. M361]